MKILFFTTVLGLLTPMTAFGQCGDGACGVGAAGTGGTSSDGRAQGFHLERPSTLFPGEVYTNVGNDEAGRLFVSDTGSIVGTFRDGISRGHTSGVFGDDSGHY